MPHIHDPPSADAAGASTPRRKSRTETIRIDTARQRPRALVRRAESEAVLDTYAQPANLACRLATAERELAMVRLQNQQLQANTGRLVLALTEVSRRRSEAPITIHRKALTVAAQQKKRKLAMLFIDLEGLKGFRDRYGLAASDRLLSEMGSRISASLSFGDIACRHGHDEFVVLLLNVNETDVATMIADKINERISRRLCIKGHPVRLTASIGVAIYPIDDLHYDALIGCGEVLMP